MLLESLLGGALGSISRLLPEVLKFYDRKEDREHELAMLSHQLDVAKIQAEQAKQVGQLTLEQKYADFDIAQLNTLEEAYKEQAVAVSKSSQWVANASAMVRPSVTYIIFGLYVLFKISMVASGISTGQPWMVVFGTWTEADMAMLNCILGFWFVSRSIEKHKN